MKAWSIVSSHVLMSSVLTFRFFLVIVFSTFFIFIFWVTVFSTFHFHTNKDALSCHTVWPNFLSCFHFQKNKVPKFLVLSHGLTSKDALSMSRRLPKNKRKKLTKERNFVSHRSLASFLFSLVKRYHTDALSVPNWKLQLKKSSSYWGFWDFFSMTTWLTIRRQ